MDHLDFVQIVSENKKGSIHVMPEFIVKSKDLMVHSGRFFAFWDASAGKWNTSEYDLIDTIDAMVRERYEDLVNQQVNAVPYYLNNSSSGQWAKFVFYMRQCPDTRRALDQTLFWEDDTPTRHDYSSKRLPYSLKAGPIDAWNELVGTLYDEPERQKIEWAIGSIVAGDSKYIDKLFVLYGAAGTGKSTILKIIEKLFHGYTATFNAMNIGRGKEFALEAFKSQPLVALSHDSDLSVMLDNTILNSLVSHEPLEMNEKFKNKYEFTSNAMLFIGTNNPVGITNTKSGLVRRVISIEPTGILIPNKVYNSLISQIDFELGAIATHCLGIYKDLGRRAYDDYIETGMMFKTNSTYNFLDSIEDRLLEEDHVTLKDLYAMYKEWCLDTNVKPLVQYVFRDEVMPYFKSFERRAMNHYSVFFGFQGMTSFDARHKRHGTKLTSDKNKLILDYDVSILDEKLANQPAQYATSTGIPKSPWADVTTVLSDIDTKQSHYVKVPENYVIIDFDLKDEHGNKSLDANLAAAAYWPPTYAEISHGGNGIHLHYMYDRKTDDLDPQYAEGIEVKVYKGNAALRRRLTKCNNIPVALLANGLPKKKGKRMLNENTLKSEKALRELIERNLRKEIHPGTKPSVDFILKILNDAYESELEYDVTDMRGTILSFAAKSSNHSDTCIKTVAKMKFKSKDDIKPDEILVDNDAPIVFFDVEVFKNLFIVCWKYAGESSSVVKMINPTADEIRGLLKFRLVGFNNRRYDNHILYGRCLLYSNEWLYQLSQDLINNRKDAYFAQAFNLSYADIYDFSSKKQGLKKFGIDLGLSHMEIDIPWDQEVPENRFMDVADYCANDVILTEAVWNARQGDFKAREILSAVSGLPVNSTTQAHTARIIFEDIKDTRPYLEYTDLSHLFPGYVYDSGTSTYKDEIVGEGGYVYAEPGMYNNVTVLDVASMHPTSIVNLNLFGPKTANFADLMYARLSIKVGDYEAAGRMLNGKLKPFLKDTNIADDLAYALKIVINTVYGLTSAKFDNPFRDLRNKDNIVAKRGALFMIDLKHAVQEQGYRVIHIKTDSIKIPDATEEIIEFIQAFGRNYGYDFVMENIYDSFCLVNDAVYIAKSNGHWEAVGAQFQHPYVFKTLFSKEYITFEDFAETRSVTKGAMYLVDDENGASKFVGRTGQFIPVRSGGARLVRRNDEKDYAVTGTKGFEWVEFEVFRKNVNDYEIDLSYFDALVDNAVATIEKFGDYNRFVKE